MNQNQPSRKIMFVNRTAGKRLIILSLILTGIILGVWITMIQMPGNSYQGNLPPLSASQNLWRDALKKDVEILGGDIGSRNFIRYDSLVAAANFLERELVKVGYEVSRQRYTVSDQEFDNLEVEIPGSDRADEIIIIGAHYDSVAGSPGANDNATGAAAVLQLARAFAGSKPARTLRFVEFVNEEPPFFWTDNMGSVVYAKRCRDRNENIVAMLSLETMGYYSDAKNTQKYPAPLNLFYPSTGNFIGFIGNISSGRLVRQVIENFRDQVKFPSEGAVLTNALPGVGWSDHWSFWQQGYPALMVTDTAPFRYPYYHTTDDTPDKVDYDRLTRVVTGLDSVIRELSGQS